MAQVAQLPAAKATSCKVRKPVADADGIAKCNTYCCCYCDTDSSGHGYTDSDGNRNTDGNTDRNACRLQHLHHGYWDWHNHGWHHRHRQPLR